MYKTNFINMDTPGIQETHTPEEVAQSISAAFDSVHLINEIIAGNTMTEATTEDKESTVERNVGHLKIMLGKEWFTEGCTEEQATDLNAAVTAGEEYIA